MFPSVVPKWQVHLKDVSQTVDVFENRCPAVETCVYIGNFKWWFFKSRFSLVTIWPVFEKWAKIFSHIYEVWKLQYIWKLKFQNACWFITKVEFLVQFEKKKCLSWKPCSRLQLYLNQIISSVFTVMYQVYFYHINCNSAFFFKKIFESISLLYLIFIETYGIFHIPTVLGDIMNSLCAL